MILNPSCYICPEHQTDLTGLVQETLENQAPPVAYRRPLLARHAPGPRPFQVIVTCPGADGADPHSLTCTGTEAQ